MNILANYDEIQAAASAEYREGFGFCFGPERVPRNKEVAAALEEFGGEIVWRARNDNEWTIIEGSDGRVLAIADISGCFAVDVTVAAKGRNLRSLSEVLAEIPK